MAEQYTYAVSRIHARELDLLSASDIEQILGSADYREAMRYLAGKGYGNGEEYSDYELMIKDETDKMWALITELIPDKEPFETLLRQTDFHNLKAAIKVVYTSENTEGCFEDGGSV